MTTLTMVPPRLFRNDSPFCEKATEIAHKTEAFAGSKRAAARDRHTEGR